MKHRLAIEGLATGENALDAADAHYLTHVLRLRQGADFEAFDPQCGRHGVAKLVKVGAGWGAQIDSLEQPPKPSPLVLIQCLAKGEKMAAIVRDATELGATDIVFAQSERAIKADARMDRYESVAREATRQSRRYFAPTLWAPMPLANALEHFAPTTPQRWILWEHARTPIAHDLRECHGHLGAVFAIGPEGGFDDREIEIAEHQGYRARLIAATTLRTETAPTCVLGAWACLVTSNNAQDVSRNA